MSRTGSWFTIVVEGVADEAIARRVVACAGGSVRTVIVSQGKGRLDTALRGYDFAAQHLNWFVLRDLDHDDTCGAALARRLLPYPNDRMCFRIAVRTAESWLLADRTNAAKWLGVTLERIPKEPDGLDHPKETIVNLARNSRLRNIRADLVPSLRSNRAVGRGFVGQVIEYAQKLWQPETAAERSPSLAGCLRALKVASRH